MVKNEADKHLTTLTKALEETRDELSHLFLFVFETQPQWKKHFDKSSETTTTSLREKFDLFSKRLDEMHQRMTDTFTKLASGKSPLSYKANEASLENTIQDLCLRVQSLESIICRNQTPTIVVDDLIKFD
jgi:hypothetical protein